MLVSPILSSFPMTHPGPYGATPCLQQNASTQQRNSRSAEHPMQSLKRSEVLQQQKP